MTATQPPAQITDGCLEQAIGAAGLSPNELSRWLDKLQPGFERLKQQAASRSLAHIAILYEDADLAEARAAYDQLVAGGDTLIVFGTGGSSLGGQAIAQLGGWHIPGDHRRSKQDGPRLRFYDNLDAISLMRGLDMLDLARTRFVVISKSGGTAETLSQALITIDRLKAAGLGDRLPQMFLGLTEPEKPGGDN